MRTTRDATSDLLVPQTQTVGDVVAPANTGLIAPGAINPVVAVEPADVNSPAASSAGNNPTASENPTPQPYQATSPAGGDDLTLMVGNMSWSGWQRVRLQRSLDSIPANFQIQVTEVYPIGQTIDIQAGQACKVYIGGDLVLTGWIDRYHAVVTPDAHTVEIMGRSKSADLVDCAAFIGGQDPNSEKYLIPPGTSAQMVTALAYAYGIPVTTQVNDTSQIASPYAISYGETPWEIIDRLSKNGQFLAYDMPDGSLMLAQAGKEQMASGFVQGVNVEQAEVNYTLDQRYSLYEGVTTATPQLSLSGGGTSPPADVEHDDATAQSRFRKHIIIVESSVAALGPDAVKKRVVWEMNRRTARSIAVTVTCDSWRDASNNLWAPNHLANVSIPVLKTPNESWCIGQVVYLKDEEGRHAIVTLMPPGAFAPEPIPFMPVGQTGSDTGATTKNNPTSANPPDAPAGPDSSGEDAATQQTTTSPNAPTADQQP